MKCKVEVCTNEAIGDDGFCCDACHENYFAGCKPQIENKVISGNEIGFGQVRGGKVIHMVENEKTCCEQKLCETDTSFNISMVNCKKCQRLLLYKKLIEDSKANTIVALPEPVRIEKPKIGIEFKSTEAEINKTEKKIEKQKKKYHRRMIHAKKRAVKSLKNRKEVKKKKICKLLSRKRLLKSLDKKLSKKINNLFRVNIIERGRYFEINISRYEGDKIIVPPLSKQMLLLLATEINYTLSQKI